MLIGILVTAIVMADAMALLVAGGPYCSADLPSHQSFLLLHARAEI